MFGLFKKKEAPAPKKEEAPAVNHGLAEPFGPFEEGSMELSAVTGSVGFGIPREEYEGRPEGPWCAVLGLTAWYEDDEPTQQGTARLVAVADQRLLAHLRHMAPRDSMIQVKVRKSVQENTYLMLDLPVPVMDPELKEILLRQVQPVVREVEDLGTFSMDRSAGIFRGDVAWEEEELSLTFAQGTEEEMERSIALARALLSDPRGWNEKALAAAAPVWEEEEPPQVTAIDLLEEGQFILWLGSDTDPEAVCLEGTLEGGLSLREEL